MHPSKRPEPMARLRGARVSVGQEQRKPKPSARPAQATLPVTVDLGDDGEIRVALVERAGKVVIEARTFEPFTAARVLMPTSRALQIPLDRAAGVAAALREVWNQAHDRGLQ